MTLRLKPYLAMKSSGIKWLGGIPEGWHLSQLGRIGQLSKGCGGTKLDEVPKGVPCIRYGDLYTQHGAFIYESRSFITQERATDYANCSYGDILFAASGETLEDIGKSAVNLIASPVCCGGDVLMFRPTASLEPRFLAYALDAPPAVHQKACMGRGVTVMHLYNDQLKYLVCAIPPLPEQTAIVRYLDYVDRRVRRYVGAKERLIERLEEQKQVIVHRAVTRGLDPNVRLKDSGVAWLGEVPEHWEVRRTKNAFLRIVGGSTPLSQETRFWGSPHVWVTPSDISKATYLFDSKRHLTQQGLENCASKLLPAGSIVVTSRAPVGNVAQVKVPFCTNQGCKTLVKNEREINSSFALNLFKILLSELQSLANGTTFTEISSHRLGEICIPLPPLLEQTAIVEHLDQATIAIDTALANTKRQIELLKEYRTRLIADVVTGKLDVREAAAALPAIDPLAEEAVPAPDEHAATPDKAMDAALAKDA